MPCDSGNLCLSDGGLEPGAIIESFMLTVGVDAGAILTWEMRSDGFIFGEERTDGGHCIRIEVDGAGVAVFGLVQIDCTAVPIELAHLNRVLFTQSHSGMDRGDELSQVFREATRGDAVEHVIFFTAQETEAALRFWALGDEFCWIVCDLFVVQAEFVRQADERLISVECGRCFAVLAQPFLKLLWGDVFCVVSPSVFRTTSPRLSYVRWSLWC